MLLKKAVLLIMTLLFAAASSGCWDAKDVNKKALVTLVFSDKQDSDFVFFAEVPNLSRSGQGLEGGMKEQYDIVTGKGKTLTQVRLELDSKMDYTSFLGSVRALVLTNNLIKNDLFEYMQRLQNSTEYRKSLEIIVTHEKPEDFLSEKSENNTSIGQSVSDTVRSSEDSEQIVLYSASDILNFLYAKHSFVLINMDLKKDYQKKRLAISGYSIIRNGKYKDFIPFEKSAGLLFLLGDKAKWTYSVKVEDITAAVIVTMKSRKITPVYENGSLTFNLGFNFDSEIYYLSQDIKTDRAAEQKIRQELLSMILQDLYDTVVLSKKERCDYLHFRDYFRVGYPSEDKNIDWDPLFTVSTVHISADTKISPIGMADLDTSGRKLK